MKTLSLYFHIPFCRRRCPYCSFYHVRPRDEAPFVDALVAETSEALASFSAPPTIRSMYFGGGTPSVLSAPAWERIVGAVRLRASIADVEFTCEVNPEDIGPELLDTIASHGVNRLSIGVQSMDAGVQRQLGRCLPDVNRRAIELARDHFENVGFDVLLGVPGRGEASLDRTIDELVAFRPAHFSVYCLEPGGDMGPEVQPFFDSVDGDHCASEYLCVCSRLKQEGYRHYEVSNFARPGRESVHNLVYWEGGDYLGLGPAAHSFLDGRRFHNPPSLERYLAAAGKPCGDRWIVDGLGPGEREIEKLMLSLRTDGGASVDALSCPREAIDDILVEGLGRVSNGRLRLTDRGFLLLNEVVLRLACRAGDRKC
jgi:oxygen-independent coproporphyrinogen-3 oxidase